MSSRITPRIDKPPLSANATGSGRAENMSDSIDGNERDQNDQVVYRFVHGRGG